MFTESENPKCTKCNSKNTKHVYGETYTKDFPNSIDYCNHYRCLDCKELFARRAILKLKIDKTKKDN